MGKNQTIRYITELLPDRTAHVLGPMPGQIPENRRPAFRLSWGSESSHVSYPELAEVITISALPDARFFLDTGFLTGQEVDQCVWDALLQRHVVITPLVWAELQDWLQTPFHNPGFRDVLRDAHFHGHPSITFLGLTQWPAEHIATAKYYTALLGQRKSLGVALREDYIEKHGHAPSDLELQRYCQQYVQDRGWPLAKKGFVDQGKPNFHADEEVVVLAVMSGILSGHETMILTRDKDLVEQFYKLLYLVDTHYRSMLVADEYAKQPANFPVADMPVHPKSDALFDGVSNRLLFLPWGYDWSYLPQQFSSVMLYCFCLGGTGQQQKLSSLRFSAEQEMSRLLDIKGVTNGRNTTALGGANCHIYFAPKAREFRGTAAVAHDRMFQADDVSFPVVDRELALGRVERISRVAVHKDLRVPVHSRVDAVGLLLATFRRSSRLTLSRPQRPWPIPAKALETGITYSGPNTLFCLDSTFVTSEVSDGIAEALLHRPIFGIEESRRDLEKRTTGTPRTRLLAEFLSSKGVAQTPSLPGPTIIWHPSQAVEYYLGLLSFRKLFSRVLTHGFERAKGRPPTDDDWQQQCEEYCGANGLRLAEEGKNRQDDPALFHAETLVVLAFLHGLMQGADLVLLTRDPLLMDQFAKLASLMRRHYLEMIVASRIFHEPNRFKLEPLKSSLTVPQDLFCGELASMEVTGEDMGSMLPQHPYLVNFHCWLIGGDNRDTPLISFMTFCAERPMCDLFRVKAQSGGKNTDRFGDRNLHFVGAPEKEGKADRILACLAHDRMIQVGSRSFPKDDRLDLSQPGYAAIDLVQAINRNAVTDEAWLERVTERRPPPPRNVRHSRA